MLIELLGTGSEEAQARAADALWSLVTENPDAHATIAGAGDPAVARVLVSRVALYVGQTETYLTLMRLRQRCSGEGRGSVYSGKGQLID